MSDTVVEISPDTAPTAEQRVARTDSQAAKAAALVLVLVWLLRLFNIDLNPIDDVDDIPLEVGAALSLLLTGVFARWDNRRSKEPQRLPNAVTVEAKPAASEPEPDDWHHRQLRSQRDRALTHDPEEAQLG